MPDDFGFDKLLADDGLIAHLLGRARSGRNRKLIFGPDLPVVLLVGGPGMGKGRLLRCVRNDFGRHVPTAHIDCGSPVYEECVQQHTQTRSEMTEVLREIALQFGAWQGDGGVIPTPRLYAGLAAVAASDPHANRATLVDEVRRHDDLLPPGPFWRGVLNRAVRGYFVTLAGLVTHPGAVPMVNAVLDELLARISKEGEAALAECYGEYPGAAGHPKMGLHSLASNFQHDEEGRENAERFLFRALREDVEAAYRSVRGRLSRVGRPAVLLDRADNALGRRLLKSVLADRESGHYDRTVVLATARRENGGRFLYRAGDTGERLAASWVPSDGGLPVWNRPPGVDSDLAPLWRGVLLVRMPALTREQQKRETARMHIQLGRSDGTSQFRIERGVHRLSGGRPLFVTRLGEASVSFHVPDDCSDWDLLDARVRAGENTAGRSAPDRKVADLLLDDLIVAQFPEDLRPQQRAHWLDLLTHLSVAHGADCAQALLQKLQSQRDDRLSAYEIAELLRDVGWPHCPRHFIGDLGLRHLLMLRLHRLEGGGAAWRKDHTVLRDHYRDLGDYRPDELFGSSAAHRLHHHLASDGAEPVTDYLAATFTTRDTRDWCEELLTIAGAPLLGGTDDWRARALGAVQIPGDTRRRRIDRVLHAVRICEDRTRSADPAVVGVLRQLLERLSDESEEGAEVLTHVARDWSELAGNKQPLQPCACTRHIG